MLGRLNTVSYIAIIIIAFMLINCSSDENKGYTELEYNSIKFTKKKMGHFMDNLTIKEVIKPELSDNSAIGIIHKVIRTAEGEYFICDRQKSRKVFKFDKNGKFIKSFGTPGQGPGEYQDITSICSLSNGELVILSQRKIMQFSAEGNLVKEVRTDMQIRDICSVENNLFLYIADFDNHSVSLKKRILIMDRDFNITGGFDQFDGSACKYYSLPHNFFANTKDKVFYLTPIEQSISIYDTGSQKLVKLLLPHKSEVVTELMKKDNLELNDINKINFHLHKFAWLITSGDYLIATEYLLEKRIFNLWLLNYKTRKAILFPKSGFTSASSTIHFNPHFGSCSEGFIGAVAYNSNFDKLKNRYPRLSNIELKPGDNPLIILYTFKKEIL